MMTKRELEQRVAELEQALEATLDVLNADADAVDEAREIAAEALGLATGWVGHKDERPDDDEKPDHTDDENGPLETSSV